MSSCNKPPIYIASKILHQPPQSCNYADNKEVSTRLNNILKKGAPKIGVKFKTSDRRRHLHPRDVGILQAADDLA
jgi:hypothetical protein